MVIVEEPMGVLAEALPLDRRRSLIAAGNESSRRKPPARRPSANGEQPERGRSTTRLESVKVLIVDDDPASLDYFSFALETCGAVVAVAASAREALEAVSRVLPDVILSDIAMPGGDGYWLLREIRRHADRGLGRLPVVAATAYGHHFPRATLLPAGFPEHPSQPAHPHPPCH